MLSRISVLLMAVLVMSALASSVTLAVAPVNKGQQGATEDKETGPPGDPNDWGTVTSQRASGPEHDLGEHSSDPVLDEEGDRETPRKGIGNVARTDSEMFGPNTDDTGDHPADHACIVDDPEGTFGPETDCEGEPGPLPA
jgi:hypothetical protein